MFSALTNIPAIASIQSSWLIFFKHKINEKRPPFALLTTQSLIPLLLLALSIVMIAMAGVAFYAFALIATALSPLFVVHSSAKMGEAEALVITSPILIGGLFSVIALILLLASVSSYPWAQYAQARAISRFIPSNKNQIKHSRSLLEVFILVSIDFFFIAVIMSLLIVLILCLAYESKYGFIFFSLGWPILTIVTVMYRIHFREFLRLSDRPFIQVSCTTLRYIFTDFITLFFGTTIQIFYMLTTLTWAVAASIPALIIATLITTPIALVHWVIYKFTESYIQAHTTAVLIEIALYLLILLLITAYLSSPLFLLQSLHRTEYVRLTIDRRERKKSQRID